MRDAILPLSPKSTEQGTLWQESVRLDEGFYQSLIEHSLPLREAAIREISNRSMAIDLYIWLAYRLHILSSPVAVSWPALHGQFGEGYKEIRFFRRDILAPLRLALAVYPEAHVGPRARRGELHPLSIASAGQRTQSAAPASSIHECCCAGRRVAGLARHLGMPSYLPRFPRPN